ncbi:MAG: hypothetical protein HAW62_03380, partial [Endozoicomonadaceae bacterium]|nr:hypothetical protein [Endozoicomonadaceae bacterium]
RDNQSYIFYDQLDHFLVVLEKQPTAYQIKSFNVNPNTELCQLPRTELCQLEGAFELAITPIPEDHIQASSTFKSIDLMTGPEIPFARQAFILDHLIKKEVNITHQDIDHESYQVMLQALHYSGYRTLEKAVTYGLHIMPPGPVFTTWGSLTGSSIFNGKNNPPRQFDLRSNLLDIANLLQPAGIPLIIVYTELNMNPCAKETLISDFDHNNILVINTYELFTLNETSYLLKKTKLKYHTLNKHASTRDRYKILFSLMDELRFAILYDKNLFIEQAIKIARNKNKLSIAHSLEQTKKGSLIYTDADNIFLKPPMYQIAPSCIVKAVIVKGMSLDYFKTTLIPSQISNILDIDTATLFEHDSPRGRPFTATIEKIELKKKYYHIIQALSSNTLDIKIALSDTDQNDFREKDNPFYNWSYYHFLHTDIGYLRAYQNPRYDIDISYQNKKLAIIQQNAWMYYARTESWVRQK